MKKRLRKALRVIRIVSLYTFFVLTIFIGVEFYRVFLAYVPGININDLINAKIGISAFKFLGISAGILISFPIIICAFEVYYHFSASYVTFLSELGSIHLSDSAIECFIKDIVSNISGVESVDVSVEIFKENRLGIHIWLDTDEKSDFVRFSERVQQRVLQDLDFNFGIKKIKFFHVYVESTNINAGGTGFKVDYN